MVSGYKNYAKITILKHKYDFIPFRRFIVSALTNFVFLLDKQNSALWARHNKLL